MNTVINTLQTISGIALIILILIQPRGKGLGRGSASNSFTRRGVEQLVFRLTFVFAFVFICTSIFAIFLG